MNTGDLNLSDRNSDNEKPKKVGRPSKYGYGVGTFDVRVRLPLSAKEWTGERIAAALLNGGDFGNWQSKLQKKQLEDAEQSLRQLAIDHEKHVDLLHAEIKALKEMCKRIIGERDALRKINAASTQRPDHHDELTAIYGVGSGTTFIKDEIIPSKPSSAEK